MAGAGHERDHRSWHQPGHPDGCNGEPEVVGPGEEERRNIERDEAFPQRRLRPGPGQAETGRQTSRSVLQALLQAWIGESGEHRRRDPAPKERLNGPVCLERLSRLLVPFAPGGSQLGVLNPGRPADEHQSPHGLRVGERGMQRDAGAERVPEEVERLCAAGRTCGDDQLARSGKVGAHVR